MAGPDLLPTDPRAIVDNLAHSARIRRLLGDEIVDATVAVRRYEQASFADEAPEAVAARLRLAWSI